MKISMLRPNAFQVKAGSVARALCVGAFAVGAPLLSQSAFAAIGTCDLASAVEVEATAGAVGPTGYTTVKGAFDAINAGTHQGVINIEVCGSTNEGTTPATLNSNAAGAALYSSVNLRPLVDGLTITGNPTSTATTGFGVIQLKGADNVTIDGDNPNSVGINRNLTINNTNVATQIANAVIRIAVGTVASTVLSADNITIRNLVLNGNVTGGNISTITSATGSSNSSFVIYAGGNGGTTATDAPTGLTSVTSNTALTGTTINNLVVQNNAMNQAARAFVFAGAAASVSTGVTLIGNTIGGNGVQVGAPPYLTPSSTVHTRGIYVSGANAVTITGNTIQNMLSYVATTANAIDLPSLIGNGGVNISGNTISNVVNNSATGGAINGIIVSASTSNPVISGNTVNSVQTLAGAAAQGIAATQTGTGGLIEMNRVSTIYSRGAGGFAANGINLIAGTAWTVQNNFVSDVNSFMNNGSFTLFGPFGIRITAGTNDKIYNNTVNLSGPVVGSSTLAASAAFVIAATSSTGVDVRNNIFINNLTGAFAGSAVSAIMLPSGGTSAMNLTLNNNDYVAPATIIGQVGTSGTVVSTYTAAAFNAASTAGVDNLRNYTSTLLAANTDNDNASIIADPALVSGTDLHITVGSPAQNTGASIAAVANDIDAQLRPGGSGYDIGADEVDGITPPANDMRATAFIDPANGGIKLVNAAFSPQASFTNLGTATQAGVTVRYRIVDAGMVEVYNQTATIASLAFNASTNVTFPAATVTAAGTYTIFASSELAGDTVPANNQISGTLVVAAPLAGSYNVGTGGDFASLTNNGGVFQALNSLGASANITLNIVSDLAGETGANALNEIVGGFTTRIQPTGAARSVIGTSTSPCLVRLNGADNVTINGALVPGGTTRDLTFNNTSTSTSSGVLCVSSLGAGLGASNNTLKNLNVFGNDPTQTLVGISLGGLTPGSAGTNNDNNRVENSLIRRSVFGIYSAGASATVQNTGTVITLNDLSGTGVDRIRRGGILIFNDNGIQVTRNSIGGISTSETADAFGIGLGNQAIDTTTVVAGGVTNALVSRNRINGVVATSDFSAAGIAVGGGATGANEISNNMISGISSPATPGDFVTGIFVVGAVGSSTKLYYNSVSMDGDRGLPAAAQTPSYAVAITGVDPLVELKNNIFNTTQTAASGGVTAESYAIGTNATTFVNLDSNFNVYNSTGANAGFFRSGALGSTVGTDYDTLVLWQAAIADDANSVFADPLFVSTTDLHLQAASPAANIGTPIAGVTVDFDGATRSPTAPEIGADELPPPNAAPTITTVAGLTRQAGSPASNSTIATVTDDAGAGTVVVTSSGAANGFSLSNIVNTNGTVTADLIAACSATNSIFTLTATDTGSLTATGDILPTVIANTPPSQGSYTNTMLTTGTGTTVTPSAAPSDNGTVTSVTVAAPGFTGALSVNPSTGVVTIGNAGPAATYTVTVTATDNCGSISTATFTLTVQNSNNPPTLTPTAAGITRQAGSAASNSQIATVQDPNVTPSSLLVTAPIVPAGLAVTNITNTVMGALEGDPASLVRADVAASCSAAVGANTVGLNVADGALNVTANLTVNVTANGAPTLGSYGATSLVLAAGTTVTPSAAPTDNGSVASVSAAAPGFTGSFSGDPGTGVITISNAGPASSTPYVVTVTATDNCGATSTTTFTLTVNAAPTITPAVGLSRQQGTAVSNSTIATVSDGEQAAGTLVVTAPSVPAGLTLNTIVNTTGTVAADLVAACTATLGANTVGLSVSDGALSTAGNLSVNVTANGVPVLGTYGATTATTGGSNTVTPSAAPSDNGSVVSLTASAPGFTGTLTGNPSTGVISVANAGPVGSYVVTVTATDNCGSTSTTTFNLDVSNSNSSPTITPALGVTRQRGTAVSNSAIATVSDAESSAGSLTVTAPTVPAGLVLNGIVNNNGNVSADLLAACGAPLGANTVVLNVSDGSLNTNGNLSVNVTANSAPVLGTYAASTVASGGATTVSPSAAPTDNGSVVTLTASAPGFAGTFIGNPSTGVISISGAAPASPTAYVVTVTATDNCESTSTSTFNLTVSNTANLDVSKDDGVTTYRAGDLLVYSIVLRNLGPDSANGVVFSDIVPATLINATWTCAAANGAACPQTGGSGSINATIAVLPATGRVTYTLQANVATPLPAQISNTAQVSIIGLAIIDPQLANNSATDTNLPEAIFRNGFEDPIVLQINKANGQHSIALATLSQLLDDTARIVFSADDASGEALRVYARRNDAGAVELALAVRGSDGLLRLGAWQLFTGNVANVSYTAQRGAAGFVLQSARFE